MKIAVGLAAAWVLAFPLLARAETASSAVRTLSDAYARALAASESIAISGQSIRQAEALYRKAFGSSFPALSMRSVTTWQDGDNGRSQSDGMMRLSQTTLNGYRELAAIRAAKAGALQKESERLRAEQLLLNDVAGAFFGLLQSSANVATTVQLDEFALRRLKELQDRVRVGRAREADAIAQKVQLAALASQLEESQRQVSALTDLLAYLTRSSVIEPRASDVSARSVERPLEYYLAKVEKRPDVGAARKAAEAAAASVSLARADRFPQLGLQGDWYGYRPAVRSHIHWDGQLIASLPIWSWGALKASVAAAQAFSSAEELALQSTRRQAELDIKNSYRNYASSRRQLGVQRQAVDLASRDYELQRRDENRGLVTSIEVLQSLDRLNGAKLALNNALLQARLTVLNLELSTGGRPLEMDLR